MSDMIKTNNPYRITVQRLVSGQSIPTIVTLKRWVKSILREKVPAAELTIRIVDVDEITQLNATFRNKNKPTNVLSFPIPISAEFNDDIPMLGDIIICAAVIQQEALEQNKPEPAHWAHMVVHGTLHLLGYDHEKEEEANIMEAEEARLLAILGFNNPYHIEGVIS